MKILNVCHTDWANFAYENAKALRSVGVDCDAVSLVRHPFYTEQAEITDMTTLWNSLGDYDFVQFFHDNDDVFDMVKRECIKPIVAYHTSSHYRKNHGVINRVMHNGSGLHRHVCAMPEFMALCPPAARTNGREPVYMVGAVNTDMVLPEKTPTRKPYKVGHFPSNPSVKGSNFIFEIVDSLWGKIPVKCHLDKEHVGHAEQLKRMQDCDIYIEMFSMRDGNGCPYGNFGITALEAAAMGKIVLTNCLGRDVYERAYGPIGLQVANDEITFKERLIELAQMELNEILDLQMKTREWVVKNHSYQASGEYILKNILQ